MQCLQFQINILQLSFTNGLLHLDLRQSSHLRQAIFGPSNGVLYGPYVARLAAKEQTGIVPIGHYIPVYGPPT